MCDGVLVSAGERAAGGAAGERTLRAALRDAAGAQDGDAAVRGTGQNPASGPAAGPGGGVPGHAGEQWPCGIRSGGAEGD